MQCFKTSLEWFESLTNRLICKVVKIMYSHFKDTVINPIIIAAFLVPFTFCMSFGFIGTMNRPSLPSHVLES